MSSPAEAKLLYILLLQVWIISWLVTAAFVFLPAAYLLLPTRILVKVDNWFDAVGDKINPKVCLRSGFKYALVCIWVGYGI